MGHPKMATKAINRDLTFGPSRDVLVQCLNLSFLFAAVAPVSMSAHSPDSQIVGSGKLPPYSAARRKRTQAPGTANQKNGRVTLRPSELPSREMIFDGNLPVSHSVAKDSENDHDVHTFSLGERDDSYVCHETPRMRVTYDDSVWANQIDEAELFGETFRKRLAAETMNSSHGSNKKTDINRAVNSRY